MMEENKPQRKTKMAYIFPGNGEETQHLNDPSDVVADDSIVLN